MMEKQNSYSHILKYTGLFGGVQVLGILVGLVRNKLVALILGPMGMGLLALFSSTIKLVGDSTNLGLSISAVRNMSGAYDCGDTDCLLRSISVFRHWCLITSLLGLLVCVVLSPLLSRWTFSFGNHTLHFILLAPVVALTTLSTGELAILKATRRLRDIAENSVYAMIVTLFVSVPIYYFFGSKGIIPSLLLVILLQTIIVMRYSLRAYPFRLNFRRSLLCEGFGFLKLGVAFVIAGMAGSGVEMAIRAYISNVDGVDTVGLYNAAYVMIFTYVGTVFTAMETDYYPRLSSISKLGREFNLTVNKQIEVSLHLVSPMLVFFILAMPVLLPMLYSGKFLPVLPMMQVAALAMYARAIFLPIEYIALSRGDSKRFLCIELVNDALLLTMAILGYSRYGLLGMGVGMTVASVLEVFVAAGFCRVAYGYKLSVAQLKIISVHASIGVLTSLLTFVDNVWIYVSVGTLLLVLDLAYTLSIMRRHVDIDIVNRIKRKFVRRS